MVKINTKKAGITLIALVITIIVLLILAGITINLTIGQEGIIKRAEQAGEEYTNAATSEREQLAELTNKTDEIITNLTGSNKPKEKIIEIELKGEKEQTTVPVNLSLEVKTDGEKITNYKWVLNSEREEIGIEEEKYTEEVVNEENTELKISESGTYYLHVLTTEDNGVKKETVKGPINVNISYHEHMESVGENENGCYIAVYHTHISSCKIVCNGTFKATERGTQNADGSWDAPIKCERCGLTSEWVSSGAQQRVGDTCNRFKCWKVTGYSCKLNDGDIEKYDLVCGKTEETIESATIEY